MMNKNDLQQNIIVQLGLQQLPVEEQAALVGKMTQLIQKRVLLHVLGVLPEEQKKQFLEASAAKDSATVDSLIEQFVPDMPQVMANEIAKLKQEMNGVAAEALQSSNTTE